MRRELKFATETYFTGSISGEGAPGGKAFSRLTQNPRKNRAIRVVHHALESGLSHENCNAV
jgi:hypothetical protein